MDRKEKNDSTDKLFFPYIILSGVLVLLVVLVYQSKLSDLEYQNKALQEKKQELVSELEESDRAFNRQAELIRKLKNK